MKEVINWMETGNAALNVVGLGLVTMAVIAGRGNLEMQEMLISLHRLAVIGAISTLIGEAFLKQFKKMGKIREIEIKRKPGLGVNTRLIATVANLALMMGCAGWGNQI